MSKEFRTVTGAQEYNHFYTLVQPGHLSTTVANGVYLLADVVIERNTRSRNVLQFIKCFL